MARAAGVGPCGSLCRSANGHLPRLRFLERVNEIERDRIRAVLEGIFLAEERLVSFVVAILEAAEKTVGDLIRQCRGYFPDSHARPKAIRLKSGTDAVGIVEELGTQGEAQIIGSLEHRVGG